MVEGAEPGGDPTDPTTVLDEFRRRLAELQAEVLRRSSPGKATRLSRPDQAPEQEDLKALNDADLHTAIDFVQKFLDAAKGMADVKDPAISTGMMWQVFGSLIPPATVSSQHATPPEEGDSLPEPNPSKTTAATSRSAKKAGSRGSPQPDRKGRRRR